VGEIVDAEHIDTNPKPIGRFLSTIYHRAPLLSAESIDVGIAQETFPDTRLTPPVDYLVTVINYGLTAPGKHNTNTIGYWVWPFDGAKDLQVAYAANPSPAPDLNTLGYAISVTVNPDDKITADTFTVSCAGHDLPARIITAANDIHQMVDVN